MKAFLSKLRAGYNTRTWRVGTYSVVAAIIVIAIAVIVNLVVSALPESLTQVDVSAEQLYTLSEQSDVLLSSVEEKDAEVTIYWLVQSGNEDSYLEKLLGRYAQYRGVNVVQVDPVQYPNFASSYTTESVTNNSLAVVCGERYMYVPYADLWTYSDMENAYYYYYYYGSMPDADVFCAESYITSAVLYVTSENQTKIYLLTGHGETGLEDDTVTSMERQNARVEELSLLTLESVPEDCDILFLTGPTSDISSDECEKILSFFHAGGSLMITTEYTEEDMPNLTALLAELGLDYTGGCIMEGDSGYYNYGYVDLILPDLGSHLITSPLTEGGYHVMLPDAQAMTVQSTLPDGISVYSLLTTSSSAYCKLQLSGLTTVEKDEADPAGPFSVGAVVSEDETGGTAVVITSTAFCQSTYDEMVSGANEDLLLNALSFLSGDTESVSIHAKTLSSDYLQFTSGAGTFLRTVLIFIIPALFLAWGIVVSVKRRRR